MNARWHNLSINEALETLGSRRSGLDINEAGSRQLKYGPNELTGKNISNVRG